MGLDLRCSLRRFGSFWFISVHFVHFGSLTRFDSTRLALPLSFVTFFSFFFFLEDRRVQIRTCRQADRQASKQKILTCLSALFFKRGFFFLD